MPIIIDHRFINRLLPSPSQSIKVVIIGTFNPGAPDLIKLTEAERIKFELIQSSEKFKKFNEVRNFYDRPQNRFWKVHDYLHNKVFYQKNSLDSINPNGLKFYYKNGLTREDVYKKQVEYCDKKGIFITDIVKQLRPATFSNIYDNFPDTAIEKSDCDWTTELLLRSLNFHDPKRIIINFKLNERQLPRISNEINKIKNVFRERVVSVLSTSGAAGNKYSELIENWGPHFID
jgi:hypothetical protein